MQQMVKKQYTITNTARYKYHKKAIEETGFLPVSSIFMKKHMTVPDKNSVTRLLPRIAMGGREVVHIKAFHC